MNEIDWQAPPLDAEDQTLIDSYREVGCPLDSLPHTDAMTALAQKLDRPATDAAKHEIYRRLLRLRKMGRLPRLSQFREAS